MSILIFSFFSSCVKGSAQDVNQKTDDLFEFNMYFYENDITAIQKYLEQGNDPDKCIGPYGWIDENPLWIALNDETDNIELINLLISYGANVNLRPYIWYIIDQRILTPDDMAWLKDIQENGKIGSVSGTTEELIYKKVEVLINANADVNAKGARNRILFPSTDYVYKAYFEKEGTRPINHVIKNNLPTIVDLLLNHTKLDENSLVAAKESGDPQMIEKIKKLWELQQK
jgi:hypothetical protein